MGRSKLENFLKVWGKDKSEGKIFAKDYYCVRCYEGEKEVGAEAFWEPTMDSNMGLMPYCNPCIKEMNKEIFMALYLKDIGIDLFESD